MVHQIFKRGENIHKYEKGVDIIETLKYEWKYNKIGVHRYHIDHYIHYSYNCFRIENYADG